MPSGFSQGGPSLFATRVRDLIRRSPVTCPASMPALQLAQRLSEEGVGSVVICDEQHAPIGIVTDRDLRQRIVAAGRDAAAVPARAIMSAPLIVVEPQAFAFDAVLEMTRRGIHHLVVLEAGRLVGIVSTYDLLRLHATQPVALAREIARAASLDALGELAPRITPLIRHLFDAGGTAYDIGQMVAELNDRLAARLLSLTAEALARAGETSPSVPYCWLVLGSEARREQTLRTDQDNGLVYADPPAEESGQAARYYTRFAEAVVCGLTTLGFPRCPADLMASNPEWCQPLSVWSGYFRRWMAEAWPPQVAAALTVFDLRPVAGAGELAETLLDIVRTDAGANPGFLGVVAREALSWESPFGLWGRLKVERRGPHRGAIDVKRAGAQQLVGAGRVHALELGLTEMNTLDRLRAAARLGVYPEGEARDIVQAYQCLLHLRLGQQLAEVEGGVAPDNWIQPADLSRADALLLREALRTVQRVKTQVSKRYKLASLPGV